tara:strand:+ start:71 stop:718 length:648 start_codon:yes stop_codon:yes gene_type:complete
MTNLKKTVKIYIIESQSDRDILHKRTEGKALSSGLELAGINHNYFQVINKKMLDECFEIIIADIIACRRNGMFAPYFHFSAHGNEQGIGLTNGDFLDWNNLREKIDYINSKLTMIRPNPENPSFEISFLNICFSVCKGFYGHKIQGKLKENKYTSLIGPIDAVDWSDSLIAFMTFYHNIIHKKNKARQSVEKMNLAAGLNNIFKISMGYGMIIKE